MFQRVANMLVDAGRLFSAEISIALRRTGRLASGLAALLVIAALAAFACAGLAAAAVVLLAQTVGAGYALAIVSLAMLILAVVFGVMVWKRIRLGPWHNPDTTDAIDQRLESQRDLAVIRLTNLEAYTGPAAPPAAPGEPEASPEAASATQPDPLLIAASAGAALAIFGPARVLRTIGLVYTGVRVVKAVSQGWRTVKMVDGIRSRFEKAAE